MRTKCTRRALHAACPPRCPPRPAALPPSSSLLPQLYIELEMAKLGQKYFMDYDFAM